MLADCLTREGNAAEAIEVLGEALAFFEALPERWGLLRAASLLAEACGALGDWPRTAILLGVVDVLSDRTGGQPFTRTQNGLSVLRARARDQLRSALDTAREAGRLLGRGDQIGTALWPAADRDREPAATSGLPLTTREHEIAELITHGLTNRQIAARLVIAERTVDTHVGRILAKLGCASRAQVAAIITATMAATAATTPPAALAALPPSGHPPSGSPPALRLATRPQARRPRGGRRPGRDTYLGYAISPIRGARPGRYPRPVASFLVFRDLPGVTRDQYAAAQHAAAGAARRTSAAGRKVRYLGGFFLPAAARPSASSTPTPPPTSPRSTPWPACQPPASSKPSTCAPQAASPPITLTEAARGEGHREENKPPAPCPCRRVGPDGARRPGGLRVPARLSATRAAARSASCASACPATPNINPAR